MSTFEQEINSSREQQGETENDQHQREAMLVVAGLITAATFEGVLQPPGGTNQDGTSNLTTGVFYWFAFFNTLGFIASIFYISDLISVFRMRPMLLTSFFAITATYSAALAAISDSSARWVACLPFALCIVIYLIQYLRGCYKK